MPFLNNGMYYNVSNHKVYASREGALRRSSTAILPMRNRRSVYSTHSARRIVLVLTELCNLACGYCYARHGNYGKDSYNRITLSQINKVMEYLDTTFNNGIENFQFFGGEPLLEIKAVDYILTQSQESVSLKQSNKSLVTNGTILNDYILQVLSEHDVYVTVSLDGNSSNHDLYRKYKKSGKGTYDKILDNINKLSHSNINVAVEFTITPTLVQDFHNGLFDVNEFLDTLLRVGVRYLHAAPMIGSFGGLLGFSSDYYQKLYSLQENMIHSAKLRRLANNALSNTYSFIKAKECNIGYCGAGLDELTIDINGDIYPCFMFINNPDYLLGSIDKGVHNYGLIDEITNNTKVRNVYCQSCQIKDMCSGCIGANYVENGDITKSSETMCRFQYNNFFISVNELLASVNEK